MLRLLYEGRTEVSLADWELNRLIAFVERPNFVMRARLRKTVQNLVSLPMSPSVKAGTVGPKNRVLSDNKNLMQPCVGLHVRHGDALRDHRGKSNLARTLKAHVDCLRSFADELGVMNVFLATDNITLFQQAPLEYREYSWYAQRRSVARKDSFDAGSTSTSAPVVFEKSKQQEVANIMVGGTLN